MAVPGTYTDFPNGVSSAGVPLLPGNPVWHMGATFYLDPESGVDGNGQTGIGAPIDFPMKLLSAANTILTDESGDKIVLLNDGTTGKSVRLTAALTMSKNNVHFWGTSGRLPWSHRSRITGESSGATFTPLITHSGNGCTWGNFAIFHDYTVDPIAVEITGQRNSYYNVHFAGMGAATGADDAAAASVRINGGDELYFDSCTFGLDTVPRSTTNAEVEIIGGATRIWFKDCFFNAFADNAGHLFVKIDGSGDIDRLVMFENCVFYNAVESTATAMTQAMNVHNTCGGMVILKNCLLIGATDWCEADNGNVYIVDAAPTAGTSGIAVAVTR